MRCSVGIYLFMPRQSRITLRCSCELVSVICTPDSDVMSEEIGPTLDSYSHQPHPEQQTYCHTDADGLHR